MPIYQLDQNLWFPSAHDVGDSDIVAIGGDVSVKRILLAYSQGIFPWYNEDEPIIWWNPMQRMVLQPHEVKVSKSSRNLLNRKNFEIRHNTCFEEVIRRCKTVKRHGQDGTWLNDDLIATFVELHRLGYAYSVEYFEDNILKGGLYGLRVNHIFCGESMFSETSNASKICFIHLCRKMESEGVKLIDCQVHNHYLEQLGAYEIPREEFLTFLK